MHSSPKINFYAITVALLSDNEGCKVTLSFFRERPNMGKCDNHDSFKAVPRVREWQVSLQLFVMLGITCSISAIEVVWVEYSCTITWCLIGAL